MSAMNIVFEPQMAVRIRRFGNIENRNNTNMARVLMNEALLVREEQEKNPIPDPNPAKGRNQGK